MAPARRSTRLLQLALQLAVLIGALVLAWRVLEGLRWRELADTLSGASPFLVGVATLCLLGRFVVWDLRWRIAFGQLGDVPGPLQSFFGLLGAVCANLITPSARVLGGLLRARYGARRSPETFGSVYGVVLFDQITHQVVVVITTWLAFIGMAALLGRPLLAAIAGAGLVVTAVLFTRWADRLGRERSGRLSRFLAQRRERFGERRRALYTHGKDAVAVVKQLVAVPRLRLLGLLLGLAFILLNGLAQWMLFLAIARPVALLAVLVAVTLGTAAGALTGTPGGIGTTEAGMIFAYMALEVARVDAVAGTLLFRGLHYLLVLGLGLPALGYFELHDRRRRREEEVPPREVLEEVEEAVSPFEPR